MADKDPQRTFDEIRGYCAEHIGQLIEHGLAHAEKQCIEILADSEIEFEDKEGAEDARQFLSSRPPEMIRTYIEGFTQALIGEKTVKETTESESLSLSLVDDEALDEMLLVGELAGRIQDHYELHIKALKRGMVRLSKKLEFEPQPEAMTPKKLILLLHESMAETELTLKQKRLIYESIAQVLELELNNLYDGVLALLQEAGEIAESENPASENFNIIYQYRQQTGQSPGPSGSPGAQAGAQAGAQPGAQPGTQAGAQPGAQSGAQSGASAGAPSPAAPPHPSSAALTPAGAGSSTGGAPLAPAQLSPVAAQSLDPALFSGSQVSQAVYNFLSRTPQVQTDAGGQPLPTVESGELLKVLSTLQNLNTQELAESALSNSASISEQINETITSKTREWAKQLSGPESNVIELVNSMFITIFEDPDLIDPVKVQIGRLQIPYIKVALLDVTLLNEPAHPARLLLNELAGLGVRINRTDEPLMTLVQDIVRNILDRFETDLNVFTESLEQLRREAEQAENSVAEVAEQTVEKAESHAKVLHTKKHVIIRLRQYLKGKQLPKELHGLLLKGFAPLLLKIYRQEGEDSPQWNRTVLLLRQIVESVQPRDSAYQLTIILDRSSDLMTRAQQAIGQLPQRMADSSLVNGLKTIYERLSKRRKELGIAPEDEPPEKRIDPLAFDPEEQLELPPELINQPSPEEIVAQLPEHIHAGTWCEVYMGHNEPAQRLKVSSILRDTAQLVFVDNTGQQSEIKDIQEFLDELDCERSRVIQDEQLFDKALTAVINNMNLMRAVS